MRAYYSFERFKYSNRAHLIAHNVTNKFIQIFFLKCLYNRYKRSVYSFMLAMGKKKIAKLIFGFFGFKPKNMVKKSYLLNNLMKIKYKIMLRTLFLLLTLIIFASALSHPKRHVPVPRTQPHLHRYEAVYDFRLNYVDVRTSKLHKHGFQQPYPDEVNLQFKAFDGNLL